MNTQHVPVRRKSSVARRNAILEAARQSIGERGVDGTSMRDLASVVGVTEGALYRHFTGKEELLEELFAGDAAHLKGVLEAAVSTGPRPWECLDELVEALVVYGFDEYPRFRLLIEPSSPPRRLSHEAVRAPEELLRSVLTRIETVERSECVEPRAVAAMIVGLVARLVAATRSGDLPLQRIEVAATARTSARAVVIAALGSSRVPPEATRRPPEQFID